MQINWFEIVALIINFFILLFVLQKLLYKPVTKAMEDRKERILKAEEVADFKIAEAEELIKNYDDKIENIESEKKSILDKSRKEALEGKNILLAEYKNEADNTRKNYMDEIEEEKENFLENLRRELGKNAVKIASKILNTISSRELEEEVYKSFINDLRNIEDNISNKEILDEERHINLYSSRELSRDEKEEIESILRKNFLKIEKISYEIDKDLILGYELSLEAYTIHNSIKNYLDEVETNITNVLENQN